MTAAGGRRTLDDHVRTSWFAVKARVDRKSSLVTPDWWIIDRHIERYEW
jgi:hypothetical protein